ncbi:MAG: acyltransferase family protein [Candidatus Thorarchaeota archaeon]|jgi:hypothetical protein
MTDIEESQDTTEDILNEDPPQKRPYYFQLDVLKAIAIAFVVMDHSLTWEIKGAMGSVFWERLSIPFFLLVMGFNMGLSYKHRGTERLRDFYTRNYFSRRFNRYVFPFIVLYVGSMVLGTFLGYLSWNEYTLLGYLPFWGPGNWFIALLFGSILVFPLVYWAFNKQPVLTVVSCFLSEILLQLVLYLYFPYPYGSELEAFIVSAIRLNVLFYLPAVGLGLWFSRGFDLTRARNFFIYIYAPISVLFMFDYSTKFLSSSTGVVGDFFTFVDQFIRGDYTLLFYGYAAFLFLLAMSGIPRIAKGKIQRFVQDIGRASYHILLFQIFYMSIVYWLTLNDAVIHVFIPDFAAIYGWPSELYYIPFYLMNLTFAIGGGLLWYYTEKRLDSR